MPLQLQNASVFDVRQLTPEQAQAQYGLRILVMRQWPRGVKRSCIDLWVPDAGPSKELLRRYNAEEIGWEQFRTEYIQEQRQAQGGRLIVYPRNPQVSRIESRYAVAPVVLLAWYARRQPVTILCWEREGHCHRYELQTLIEQTEMSQEEQEALAHLPEQPTGQGFQLYGGHHG